MGTAVWIFFIAGFAHLSPLISDKNVWNEKETFFSTEKIYKKKRFKRFLFLIRQNWIEKKRRSTPFCYVIEHSYEYESISMMLMKSIKISI